MKLGIRRWMLLGVMAGLMCHLGAFEATAQDQAAGKITHEQLGELLKALRLEPKLVEERYDFAFKAKLDDEEWQLSMSTVLSQDQEWVWVMAWLDELPTKAEQVPRTALLRLLAENDRLGNGKFFAYIPANRRFVMQLSVPNRDLTTARLQEIVKDLGSSVVETHPQWSVANWASSGTPAGGTTAPAAATAPSAPTR